MILARNSITLHHLRDITTVVWYYKLQASTASPPTKPTTETPSGWSTTEPSYTEGSTNSLYVVQKTTFSDGTFEYSDVSLSTSYEAAKAAYNKSVQAKDAADAALQQSVWYAVCDTAAGTTAKVATITPATTDFALQAGAVVNVKFSNTNSGAVGSLTLNVNGTGAKPIKYINNNGAPGNIAGANYLRSGNMYQFSYDGTNWIVNFNYNTNNVDRTQYGVVLAASEEIAAGQIGVLGTNGKLHLLNTTAFDIKCPPLYVATAYSAANVTSEATRQTNYSYWGTAFNLTNTHAITGAVAGKPVYIVGTMSGDVFTPATAVLTCTEPTTDDGLLYMRLGRMSTTSNAVLEMDHPIYVYYDGAFRKLSEAEEMKAAKVADNYLSSDNTGIMVADMTDGNTYTPSNVPSGVKNTFIDEDSFQVRDGTDVLARFGTTSQIGTDDANHQVIDGNGISGVNVDGLSVFNVAMNAGNIQTTVKRDVMATDALWSIPGGGTPTAPDYIQTTTTMYMPFDAIPSLRDLPPIVPSSLMYFRVGEAPRSAQSLRNFVSGVFRYGDETPQTLRTEHVEFVVHYDSATNTMMAEASLIDPSIEVTYDDSITVALATGNDPFTFVVYTPAPAYSLGTRMDEHMSEIGAFSGICGEFLSAKTRDQFACGRFNRDESDYAFMVGNGDDTTGYSNALAVTWDGNQLMALDETAASGTDAELYSAITSLGWESEVLV